jgi:glycosyltransferase involved in cell wall biosynthesis
MSDIALIPDPRPRVLAVTSEPPWPLNSGGHLRSYHLLKALAAETDLRVVCPTQSDQAGDVRPLLDRGLCVHPVPVGRRTKLGEAGRVLGAMLRREPYVMYRRHAWPAVRRVWNDEVRTFRPDVQYLDHLDSFRYHTSGIPAVLDLHNVYSLLAARTAMEQTSPLKKAFLIREAKRLMRVEGRAAKCCSSLCAVSSSEAATFRDAGARAVHVVPNGVDCAAFADLPTGRPAGPPTVLFLGTMSWGPNAAAARFLIDILPQIRARVPDAKVQVVGRDPPAELQPLHGRPGVEVTGGVPDVKPYFAGATLLAVPLDAGGGTRLKILEAFAAGLPVVSTAVGAEGIDARPGVHFVRAERPQFAGAVADLLGSPDAGARMAAAGRELARGVYDWGRIGRKMVEVVLTASRG